MKLKAANRLHQVLAKEQPMDLQYLTDVLDEQGIKTVIPDDANNSVIAHAELNQVITTFALRRWTPIEKRDSGGGLYCNSVTVILGREGREFKVTHTAPYRTVLWTLV